MTAFSDVIPVRYRQDLEHAAPDEPETIAEMVETFVGMARTVATKEGHAFRAVHAKGHGLLRGSLAVTADLPEQYAQGLFAYPASFEALVRFSSPPAEQLSDGVSTPRAIALKVRGVSGDRMDAGLDDGSQDFLMVNGPAFPRPHAAGFLKDSKLLAATTEKAPQAKAVLSAVLRGTEQVLEAVGLESATVKNLGGHPQVHPLGETYFTQVPFLYGPYIAKFSITPVSPSLAALQGQHLQENGDDAQREAIAAFFRSTAEPAQWALRVQLCVDVERMPIEDASVPWPAEASPWITVATLSLPMQQSWEGDATQAEEDALAFSPWNGLAAHRPLGGLNRARKVVMAASREHRAAFNECPIRGNAGPSGEDGRRHESPV